MIIIIISKSNNCIVISAEHYGEVQNNYYEQSF